MQMFATVFKNNKMYYSNCYDLCWTPFLYWILTSKAMFFRWASQFYTNLQYQINFLLQAFLWYLVCDRPIVGQVWLTAILNLFPVNDCAVYQTTDLNKRTYCLLPSVKDLVLKILDFLQKFVLVWWRVDREFAGTKRKISFEEVLLVHVIGQNR